MKRTSKSFEVTTLKDGDIWIAICDDIPIATEACTYEALIQRVWAIAPEIAVMNGLRAQESDVHLRFVVDTPACPDYAQSYA